MATMDDYSLDNFAAAQTRRRAEQLGGLAGIVDRFVGDPIRRVAYPTEEEAARDKSRMVRRIYHDVGLNPEEEGQKPVRSSSGIELKTHNAPETAAEIRSNPAGQESGSGDGQRGKSGESKEKGSAPPSRTNFSNTGLDESGRPRDDLSRYGADRYVPVGPRLDSSEYEGLRRNQTIQSGPSLDEMSDKPLVRSGSLDDPIPGSTVKWGSREGVTTTGGPQYSLSDVAGRDRVREQVDSAHQARLAAIGPDPYDERQKDISESRKREEEYQESQPASNDELNRLGLSGNYTRGQIKKIAETRAAQEAADERARYAADAAYRAAAEKARIEADAQLRGVPGKQQQDREALLEKYNQRLTRIRQDAARGLITSEEATYEAQKAKEEFAMFSDQASGRSIYTPAPSSGGL
jgi:hypothetical protein